MGNSVPGWLITTHNQDYPLWLQLCHLDVYSMAAEVKELDFYTRINKDFRSDLCWWHTFMANWNGLSRMWLQSTTLSFDASI